VDTKINKKAGGKEIGCTQSLETQWTMWQNSMQISDHRLLFLVSVSVKPEM
jgi:hypothetical protein